MGFSDYDCTDFIQISSNTYDSQRICGDPTLDSIIVNENTAEIFYVGTTVSTPAYRYFRLNFKQIPKEIV